MPATPTSSAIWDEAINDIGQIDIVEANLLFHLPFRTRKQRRLQARPSTPSPDECRGHLGARQSALFAQLHLYIWCALQAYGGLATIHVNDIVDIYRSGSIPARTPRSAAARSTPATTTRPCLHGWFRSQWPGRRRALHRGAHPYGPRKRELAGHRGGLQLRSQHGIPLLRRRRVRLLFNDNWTLIADFNWVRDDGFAADGYGVAGYALYKINDIFKVIGRAEIGATTTASSSARFRATSTTSRSSTAIRPASPEVAASRRMPNSRWALISHRRC